MKENEQEMTYLGKAESDNREHEMDVALETIKASSQKKPESKKDETGKHNH